MSGQGVVLYGPPASGKDTITHALHLRDPSFVQFRRLKCGSGRTTGYRMISRDELAETRHRGDVLWENSRYGSTYVVDRSFLLQQVNEGNVPVVHLGQVEAVDAVINGVPLTWTVVELVCPRDVALQRIAERQTGDTDDRITAFDATERLPSPDLVIDTSTVEPDEAASLILAGQKP